MGQTVGNLVFNSFHIDNFCVESGQVIHPSDLSARQFLLSGEVLQCLVVGNNFEWESEEFILPFEKRFEYRKRVSLEHPIVMLGVC